MTVLEVEVVDVGVTPEGGMIGVETTTKKKLFWTVRTCPVRIESQFLVKKVELGQKAVGVVAEAVAAKEEAAEVEEVPEETPETDHRDEEI